MEIVTAPLVTVKLSVEESALLRRFLARVTGNANHSFQIVPQPLGEERIAVKRLIDDLVEGLPA